MKLFTKLAYSFLFTLFISLNLSCEAEKELLVDSSKNEVIIKPVSSRDILNNPRLNQLVNRFKNIHIENSLSKVVYDSLSGVFFDDEKGLYIANDSVHSYTFPIIKFNPNEKVENICFNLNGNGDYDVYLVKYDYTKSEYLNLTEEQLKNKETQFVALYKEGVAVESYVYMCIDVIAFVSTALVPIQEGELVGVYANQGGNGTWVTIATNCFFTNITASGDDGGGFNNGLSSGSSGSMGDTGGSGNGIITGSIIDDTENIPSDTSIDTLINVFSNSLNEQQLAIFNSHPEIRNFLVLSNCSPICLAFTVQLINNLIEDPNSESVAFAYELFDTVEQLKIDEYEESEILEVINVVIYAKQNNYQGNNLDSNFYTAVDNDSSVNFIDPTQALNFARMFIAHCAIINQEHPNWTYWQVFGQAWLDTSHLILDLAGLVPAFGEFADITNGVIYTIEGDGANAVLSYASAIPIEGWFAAGIKFAKRADGLKYIVSGANNLINFGAANSKRFRQICGIAVGDATKQAHHIIPRGSQIVNHPVVQKAATAAANDGFHIDNVLNGVAVATWRNQPNHNAYNNLIKTKLDNFIANHPNATPTECYNELMDIIHDAKQAIINNPNVHLNNLIF